MDGNMPATGPLPTPPVSSCSSTSVLKSLLGHGCCYKAQATGEDWNVGYQLKIRQFSAAPETKSHPLSIYSTASHLRAPITSLNIPVTIRYVSLINKWQVVKVTDTSYSVHHLMLPLGHVEWLWYELNFSFDILLNEISGVIKIELVISPSKGKTDPTSFQPSRLIDWVEATMERLPWQTDRELHF